MRIATCITLFAALMSSPAAAQVGVAQVRVGSVAGGADPQAVPLYPAGSLPTGTVPESWTTSNGTLPDGTHIVSRIVRNVAVPTLTPVLPDPAKATGAAVIVAPGGAFQALSIDDEGFNVARWLADHGIAAFVLKYRLNPTPADEKEFGAEIGKKMAAVISTGSTASLKEPHATLDAMRGLSLVRENAVKWHIDPTRVGIMGFSAGAMTTMQVVVSSKGAAQPAFIGYIYGPMNAITVPADAPPMFAALAIDDKLFGRQGFGIVDAWHQAGRPVELHAYERGGHGFGMGRIGTTSTLVMEEFRLWLQSRGFLTASP